MAEVITAHDVNTNDVFEGSVTQRRSDSLTQMNSDTYVFPNPEYVAGRNLSETVDADMLVEDMADIPTTRHPPNAYHEQTDPRHADANLSIPTRCKDHHDDHHPPRTTESAVDNGQTIGSADVDISADENLCLDDMAASKSGSEEAQAKAASNSYVCVPRKNENTFINQTYFGKALRQPKYVQNPCNHNIYAPSSTTTTFATQDSRAYGNDIKVIPKSDAYAAQSGEPVVITDHDTNVEPYAVAYEWQNPTYETEYNSKNDTDQADPIYDNDDIPQNRLSPNINPSSPRNAQNWNLAYMQNVPEQASCHCTHARVGVAVKIAAMVPSPTPDTTYTPGRTVVNTTYTSGHPDVDTTYTSGHPDVDTTYTPGRPDVDTTYTPGHPDTTYTPGHPVVDTTYTPGRTVVTTLSNTFSHPTILPLDPTGPKREASTRGQVTHKKKWRDDLRCGPGFPAENGKDAECDPDSDIAPCCSTGSWCGNTADHCDCWFWPVAPKKKWRDDLRCGPGFPAENGKDAECDPDSDIAPCCSTTNWCGNTADHCDCRYCVDFRTPKRGSGL
ncbi:hypothetical protein Bbelb_155050 [Branchiostoma belcheri]|nr:hypothetical protein Bbelb_155050 [Branchiostoma belcheri]